MMVHINAPCTLNIPVTDAVGPVEWVETDTRLYGIDSLGMVFVFKPPFTTPRHRSNRRGGYLVRQIERIRSGLLS